MKEGDVNNEEIIERLKNENSRLRYELSLTRGERGICLNIDGKDMTDIYTLQKEINEKDAVIKFLKKELQHKNSYRQVMKRQYRDLKQKYDSLCKTCKDISSDGIKGRSNKVE